MPAFALSRRALLLSGAALSLGLPPGARVSFVTGPGAVAFRPAGLRAEPLGNTPDGFVKYRLGHAG